MSQEPNVLLTVYNLCYSLTTLVDHTHIIDKLCDVLDDVHNLNDIGLFLHFPNLGRPQLNWYTIKRNTG